jgi:adenylate cyclase
MSSSREQTDIRRNSDRIIDWLLSEETRRFSHSEMISGLAEILVFCGVPLSVLSSSQQTYQPEVSVLNARWKAGEGTTIEEFGYSVTEGEAYTTSPVFTSRETSKPVRVRLDGDPKDVLYPICRTLAKGGATDYYLFTLPREFGAFVSFASDAVGGFRNEDIKLFDRIKDAIGVRLELYTARWGIDSLLHLYLGRNAAKHVMSGSFRLGKSEDIEAVIWMCDLRGFTSLTEGASIDEVLRTLNQYFECVVGPIRKRGGEVLKFIGDAVLAIFPIEEHTKSEVCHSSLEAAQESLELLQSLNQQRTGNSLAPLNFGIALHLGTVSYGNIGTAERLDFTVIGAAVNEAARIEGLCSSLKESLLVSKTFEEAYEGESLKSLGKHNLKGVHDAAEVFTLR